jgi:predicted membrane protein
MFDLTTKEMILLGIVAYATFTLAKNVMYIAIILIGAYVLFIRKKKETLENNNNNASEQKANSRACSQHAINKGHLDYTFSTPKFVR